MAVRGLTRFARPCGVARSRARGLSGWLRQLSNPGRGFSSLVSATCEKKARTCVRALLKIWRWGGLTRFARPCEGSPLTVCAVCPTGVCQLSNPGRGSHPPVSATCEKKPVLAYELFLKYGGEGIDSLRSPPAGSPLTVCAVCPTGVASCRTPVGVLIPRRRI